ncbi:NAD(P)-dependent oxidoreductase [Pectobacteriaceae bacterium CE70]|nr:NAD(P)-dependent oxidoreductase [Pectobacteriaceae bacterium CE70]WJY12553.1 NAD(P)-dependent oxidoreductase [Pectobacteriaceae bacterium C80]
MKRVLVTGSTGFVGRHIIGALQKYPVKVRAIVRTGKAEKLSDFPCIDEIVETENLFTEDESWWADAAQNVDIVIHSAWYAEPGKYVNSVENINCLTGTLTMAKGCITAGVNRFVGLGSCAEYDTSFGFLSVNTPLKPTVIYTDAKASAYLTLSHWLPESGVEFVWCRLFYLFGDGEDKRRFIPYLHSKLAAGEKADLSSGNQIRDYLNVTDAGQMIVDAAMQGKTGAVNICSGIPVTIKQLAESIADEYNRRDLLNFGARPDNLIDPPCIVGIL